VRKEWQSANLEPGAYLEYDPGLPLPIRDREAILAMRNQIAVRQADLQNDLQNVANDSAYHAGRAEGMQNMSLSAIYRNLDAACDEADGFSADPPIQPAAAKPPISERTSANPLMNLYPYQCLRLSCGCHEIVTGPGRADVYYCAEHLKLGEEGPLSDAVIDCFWNASRAMVAAERERCAKIAEQWYLDEKPYGSSPAPHIERWCGEVIASKIRAAIQSPP
jgi:hypothetical protein